MEYWLTKYGVADFHFEDVNPTINKNRIQDLAKEILKRKLKIIWKLVSGTKVETFDEETLRLIRKAGCKYISISPESGSPDVMKRIGKPFDLQHALKMLKVMNEIGIFSQVCFVLGFPGETADDLKLTMNMAVQCAKNGADEIAIFIITPLPGSQTYYPKNDIYIDGFKSLETLTFSPLWRSDYKKLAYWRLKIALIFNITKFIFFPLKVIKFCYNILTGCYETKTEQLLRRILFLIKILIFKHKRR